ncbi:hypothetical protein FQN54_001008 [Arachnomyces sp. PD_36]|nr:hypothetical protein FQN54_001008 [Arachnomyces sp. PD_36]
MELNSERSRSRKRNNRGSNKKARVHSPASPPVESAQEDSDDLDGTGSDASETKDETELKLESLVFGDQTGFHDSLKSYERGLDLRSNIEVSQPQDLEGAEEKNEGGQAEDTLAGLADEDLFFLDSGTAPSALKELPPLSQTPGTVEYDDEFGYPVASAAWEDSDDERISVPLAGNNRLRKLRVAEGEDVVSGREYVKRLRLQFSRLHPSPEWVRQIHSLSSSSGRYGGNEVAMRGDGESDVSGSGIDEDTDSETEETLSLPPLGKILQNTENLTLDNSSTAQRGLLRQSVVGIQKLKDVGEIQPSSIDSLSFHPHYPLLLSSGPASTLYLHHVSPNSSSPNPLLTSLHIRRTPIHTSAFCPPTGNQIIFSGRRRFFHVWDLDTGKISKIHGSVGRKEEQRSMELFKPSPCGRWIGFEGTARKGGGLINIINTATAQWVAQARVDSRGGVADFAWWNDGEGISVVGKSGEVSEWDGRLKRVVAKWTDQGAVGTTVLSLGGKSGPASLGGDRWVAIGSSSGVVNLYDRRAWASPSKRAGGGQQHSVPEHPKPIRVLDQLTTPISHLVFSNDGQLLVMASRWKRSALRLVHLPSCTVFQNWPTQNTPLGRVAAVALSPNSDLLAVGNEQGKMKLWQING